MAYFGYNVSLTQGQKENILKSYQKRAPLTLRLKNDQLSGKDKLMLTKTQIKRIEKSKSNGTGTDIKISTAQIGKQDGGNLFSSLLPLLTKTVLPLATKAIGPLASGALSGLSSFGVNKILGGKIPPLPPGSKGMKSLLGNGLFSVPQNKVDKLIKYKDYLTAAQKKQIVSALQSGSGIPMFKLTKKQSGGFLGTLLASIGVPLLLNALTGKGLQVDPHASTSNFHNVYVPPKANAKGKGHSLPYQSPPFYGSWDEPVGLGIKRKKKGKGLLLGKNSPFNGIPLLGAIL